MNVPSYDIAQVFFFADLSDYPVDDVFVLAVRMLCDLLGVVCFPLSGSGCADVFARSVWTAVNGAKGHTLSTDTVFGIPSSSMMKVFFCTVTLLKGPVVFD